MKTKVALVSPLTTEIVDSTNMENLKLEYLGFGYIASFLRDKNIEVDIIDGFIEGLNVDDISNKLKSKEYDFVFFTLMSSDYLDITRLIINSIDNINFKIVVGGLYSSHIQEQLYKELPEIDYVLIGEGEYSSYELVNGNDPHSIKGLIWKDKGKIIKNEKRPLLTNEEIEKLPFPSRDTLPKIIDKEVVKQASILGSRGCIGNCHFCGVANYYNNQIGKRWRSRSAQSIINEIKYLVEKYDVNYIYFMDDEFIGPGERGRNRAKEFAKLLIESNLNIKYSIFTRVDLVDYETMKVLEESGMDTIFIGIEFGVDRLLKLYNKGITTEKVKEKLDILNKLKTHISIGYLMFEPTMSIDELKENIKFYFENIDVRLKTLMYQIAIYDNSTAYEKLDSLIEIDSNITKSNFFGDIHEYKFNDSKVEIVLNILKRNLINISPSKALSKLRKAKLNKRDYDYYRKIWSDQLYFIIDNLIDRLISQDINEINIDQLSKEFGQELLQWDTQLNLLEKVAN